MSSCLPYVPGTDPVLEPKVERGTCRECSNGTTSGERKRDASMLMRSSRRTAFSFEVERGEGNVPLYIVEQDGPCGTRNRILWSGTLSLSVNVLSWGLPLSLSLPLVSFLGLKSQESEGRRETPKCRSRFREYSTNSTEREREREGKDTRQIVFKWIFLSLPWNIRGGTRNEIIIVKVEPTLYDRVPLDPRRSDEPGLDNKGTIK